MNNDRELMQMALDALRLCTALPTWPSITPVIEALRTRLSQCERCGEVNPAEIHTCTPQVCCQEYETCTRPCTPRGREQTKREWQGLTDEEIMSLLPGAVRLPPGWVDTVRAIEAKLKEKNAPNL